MTSCSSTMSMRVVSKLLLLVVIQNPRLIITNAAFRTPSIRSNKASWSHHVGSSWKRKCRHCRYPAQQITAVIANNNGNVMESTMFMIPPKESHHHQFLFHSSKVNVKTCTPTKKDHGNGKRSSALNTSGLTSTEINTSADTAAAVKFRPGQPQDEIQIKFQMIRTLMNPLNINYNRFIVAVNPSNNNDIYGFVQIRPIGSISYDPNEYNSQVGSGSRSSPGSALRKLDAMEEDIEEDLWYEFENDDDELDFPNGFGSLPWSKEYRTYVEKTKERRLKYEARMKELDRMKQDEKERQQQEQQQQRRRRYDIDDNDELSTLWELASVYVKPQWRKMGIGSELIRRIMAKHSLVQRNPKNVYLLTLDTTVDWYQRFGFDMLRENDKAPSSMNLEIAAGEVITKVIVGSKLVCMRFYGVNDDYDEEGSADETN